MKSPFRAIRHKLFHEGKLLRYLTYAIGEIALIIIGIMLALQLNNWNEDRKAQVEFDEYLVQLKEDVSTTIDNLEDNTVISERVGMLCLSIEEFLDKSAYTAEELALFENGLNSLGLYPERPIDVGLFGQLLQGDISSGAW